MPRVKISLSSCLCLLIASPPMVQARRPCPPPPATRVIWPSSGVSSVPKNGAVFFTANAQLISAWLRGPNEEELPVKLTTEGDMHIAQPSQEMEAGQTYQLQAKVRSSATAQGQTGGESRVVTVVTMLVDQRVITDDPLKPPRARVSFSKVHPESASRSNPRKRGREGRVHIKLPKRSPLVVISLDGELSPHAEYELGPHVSSSHVIAPSVQFTSLSADQCWSVRPGAPIKGRYRLTLRAWSASGQRGRAQTLKGRIP